MIFASISAIFALITGNFARYNLPKGWQLLKVGWLAISTGREKAKVDVENRRMVDEGARFFIAGVGWLLAGMVAAILTVIFVLVALHYSNILPI